MAFILNALRRRKLGLREKNVRRILLDKEASGQFAEINSENLEENELNIALSVAKVLKSENLEAWCDADAKEINWDKFFEALMELISMLMPFIIKKRKALIAAAG